MTTLYRPVLIETVEQAEALPIGTIAAQAATERWPALACIRVDYGWHCTGETDDDGDMALIGHDLMVGDLALVLIEAEEETTEQIQVWRGVAHIGPRSNTPAPSRRLVTPWEAMP